MGQIIGRTCPSLRAILNALVHHEPVWVGQQAQSSHLSKCLR
ncbi:hypothetical protein [Moraxella lacunata]